MKKGKFLFFLIVLICFFCSACVDYKGINENSELNNLEHEATLGDIDNDGIIESVSVNGSEIYLLSEKKQIALLKTNNEWKKPCVQACVIDVDNDDDYEIVVSISDESIEEAGRYLSVYLIDNNENGAYGLREFPIEVNSDGSSSGLQVSAVPKENYLYEVKCLEYTFFLDATRIYGLSRLNSENIQ